MIPREQYLDMIRQALRRSRVVALIGKPEALLVVSGLMAHQSASGTATHRTFAELAPAFSIPS